MAKKKTITNQSGSDINESDPGLREGFLKLPLELRLEIDELLLQSEDGARLKFTHPFAYYDPFKSFASLLRTCRTIHAEAHVLLYRKRIFEFHGGLQTNRFLTRCTSIITDTLLSFA